MPCSSTAAHLGWMSSWNSEFNGFCTEGSLLCVCSTGVGEGALAQGSAAVGWIQTRPGCCVRMPLGQKWSHFLCTGCFTVGYSGEQAQSQDGENSQHWVLSQSLPCRNISCDSSYQNGRAARPSLGIQIFSFLYCTTISFLDTLAEQWCYPLIKPTN